MAMAGMSAGMAGWTTSLAQFWSLPTAILAGAAAATGIALINSIGNLSGFVGPLLIGWLVDHTGSTDFGVYALAGGIAIGSMLVLTIPARIVNPWTGVIARWTVTLTCNGVGASRVFG